MFEHLDDLLVEGLQEGVRKGGERQAGGIHEGHDALPRNVDVMLKDDPHQTSRNLFAVRQRSCHQLQRDLERGKVDSRLRIGHL